jgi:type I site-specific restriction endonuclease
MSNFKSTKTDRSESLFGEVIFSYTRAQAIADRVLIDVTPTALEAGFRFPVATTAALMAAVARKNHTRAKKVAKFTA